MYLSPTPLLLSISCSLILLVFPQNTLGNNGLHQIHKCDALSYQILDLPNVNWFRSDQCEHSHLRRTKRQTYELISKSLDKSYEKFDRYLNLTGEELIDEIEKELENAFDKNLNVSITEALQKEAKGDLNLLKNKTHFLNTYNEFKKSYCAKLEHWYLGITLYLPMKMKNKAKEQYFYITKHSLPEKEQLEKFWEYERDLDYQFNIFAKKLRDYLQEHYVKLEKTFHLTFTHNTNSTVDLTLFKVIKRDMASTVPY